MAADRPATDFGSKLREARERRGISLRQIANATKISVRALEALERNDISRLPGGIFSRAFVRSYAVEVGLDAEATIQDPRSVAPDIVLIGDGETWLPRRDLLASDRFAPEFVVEMEEDGRAQLRFGDDVLGRAPAAGARSRSRCPTLPSPPWATSASSPRWRHRARTGRATATRCLARSAPISSAARRFAGTGLTARPSSSTAGS